MTQIPKDVRFLDEKIQNMKQKGLGNKKDIHTKFSQTSIAIQIVIELFSGVVVGAGIGYMLNEIFDFGSIFLISLIILGGLAGCLNVARYLKQVQQQGDKDKGVKNG
mgnify:CR=1 FL=1